MKANVIAAASGISRARFWISSATNWMRLAPDTLTASEVQHMNYERFSSAANFKADCRDPWRYLNIDWFGYLFISSRTPARALRFFIFNRFRSVLHILRSSLRPVIGYGYRFGTKEPQSINLIGEVTAI